MHATFGIVVMCLTVTNLLELMAVSGQSDRTHLWGWETFFDELGRFLESSGRNFSTSNESYAVFVLERLEVYNFTERYQIEFRRSQ